MIMSDIVTVDVEALIQAVMDDENGSLVSLIENAVDERLSESIEEAVSDCLRYGSDVSDMVSDCVSDYISPEIESLLDQVTPGSLCAMGEVFKSAIHTILKHHIDDWKNIFEDTDMNNAMPSTDDIEKAMAERFNKEMKVEVTFVDKEPATVVSGDIE